MLKFKRIHIVGQAARRDPQIVVIIIDKDLVHLKIRCLKQLKAQMSQIMVN